MNLREHIANLRRSLDDTRASITERQGELAAHRLAIDEIERDVAEKQRAESAIERAIQSLLAAIEGELAEEVSVAVHCGPTRTTAETVAEVVHREEVNNTDFLFNFMYHNRAEGVTQEQIRQALREDGRKFSKNFVGNTLNRYKGRRVQEEGGKWFPIVLPGWPEELVTPLKESEGQPERLSLAS